MMRGPPHADSRTDEALLEAFRGGEQQALAALYDRHARTVMAFAWRYCGDGDLAEDVVQDCFRELIDRIHEFELRGKLTSWFYVVAKRRALRLRDRAWRAQGELDEASLAIPDRGPPETGDLRRLLSRLPRTSRKSWPCASLDGWDLQSIAEALEIPVGTVKSRIHNALEQLRNDQTCRKYFDREDS